MKAFFPSGMAVKLRSVATRYRGWGHISQQAYGQTGRNRLLLWDICTAEQTPAGGGENFRDERLAELEAILFLAPHPITSRKLAELAGLADGTKARTLIRTLNRMYDVEGCAFQVKEVAGGFQLMTRAKFAPWLRRLHSAAAEVRLSGPAMETLAVVAYRQPILRAEIEAIRGVQSGEVLRQLIERDLVRIVGRSAELGRPFLYGTTKRFMQIFGLKHIEELPRLKILQNNTQTTAGLSPNQTGPLENNTKQLQYSLETQEEKNVKTLTTTKSHLEEIAEQGRVVLTEPEQKEQADLPFPRGQYDDEDDDDDDYDEDEDFDEDQYEDEEEGEDEEEDEDEELDEDEPWEEVEDDEEGEDEFEDEEDEGWEDEDWDDEDWEDEDEDFDEDEDKDEDKDEEK
jgi:segregation and condensation protein B